MTAYGYARVSTLNQDLTVQQRALHAAGCRVIRAEKASGSGRDGRSELQVLLDFVQPGDALVVTRIDPGTPPTISAPRPGVLKACVAEHRRKDARLPAPRPCASLRLQANHAPASPLCRPGRPASCSP
jgi:hypothetical protein